MTTLTVRDVPDPVLTTLKARAAQAGKSLQAYTLEILSREASRPTLAEITARAEAEASSTYAVDDVLSVIDDMRAGRA